MTDSSNPATDNISVIIPTRNRPEFLKEAVDSVLNQTLTPWEVIIVDDCSDSEHDHALEHIMRYNRLIQLHRLKAQKGASFCRNLGLEVATGDFVLFLDDDDTLNPTMLEESRTALDICDVVSCRTHVFFEDDIQDTGRDHAYNWQKEAPLEMYDMETQPGEHIFLYHPVIHSFVFKKSVFADIKFPEDLAYGEDFYVWLQLATTGFKFKKIDAIGGNYRIHKNGLTSAVHLEDKLKFYRRLLKELTLSKEIKNLTHIKMGIVLAKAKRIGCISYLFKAILRPGLTLKHLRHYAKFSY